MLTRANERRPKTIVRQLLRDQSGITLLELTVVSAILAILAALVAVGVSGKATDSRESTRGNDQAEVQKAVDSFSGEHPHSRYPTFNGCLPGKPVLDLITKLCVASTGAATSAASTNSTNLQFNATENELGIDLNGDGSITSYLTPVVPIIWDKSFTTTEGETKKFVPSFVPRYPKHAFELSKTGLLWKTNTPVADPDSTTDIVAPTTLQLADAPVWVLDSAGKVWILLPEGRY